MNKNKVISCQETILRELIGTYYMANESTKQEQITELFDYINEVVSEGYDSLRSSSADTDLDFIIEIIRHYPAYQKIKKGIGYIKQAIINQDYQQAITILNSVALITLTVVERDYGKEVADDLLELLKLAIPLAILKHLSLENAKNFPLVNAVRTHKIHQAIEFIRNGYDVNERDDDGLTALHYSSVDYNFRQLILKHPKIKVNIQGAHKQYTALALTISNHKHSASRSASNFEEEAGPGMRDFSQMARDLLSHSDTDPNIPDNTGNTPLLIAIQLCNLEMVDVLLTHNKTDPNKANIYGVTPLLKAVSIYCSNDHDTQNMWPIIIKLVEHGCVDVNAKYMGNHTALSIALSSKKLELAKMLIHRKDIILDPIIIESIVALTEGDVQYLGIDRAKYNLKAIYNKPLPINERNHHRFTLTALIVELYLSFNSPRYHNKNVGLSQQQIMHEAMEYIHLWIKYGVTEALKDIFDQEELLCCEVHLDDITTVVSEIIFNSIDYTTAAIEIKKCFEDIVSTETALKLTNIVIQKQKDRSNKFLQSRTYLNDSYNETAFSPHTCKYHQAIIEQDIRNREYHQEGISDIVNQDRLTKFLKEEEKSAAIQKREAVNTARIRISRIEALIKKALKLLRETPQRKPVGQDTIIISQVVLKHPIIRTLDMRLSYPQKGHKHDIRKMPIIILATEILSKLWSGGMALTNHIKHLLNNRDNLATANFVMANLKFIVSDRPEGHPDRSREVIDISIGVPQEIYCLKDPNNTSLSVRSRHQSGLDYLKKLGQAAGEKMEKLKIDLSNIREYFSTFHHSEQALFEHLKKPSTIKSFVQSLREKNILPHHKVYAVILDMFSTRELCSPCTVATKGVMNKQSDEFIGALQKELGNQSYKTPKNGIRMVTRVVVEEKYQDYSKQITGDEERYIKLDTQNIKDLDGQILLAKRNMLEHSEHELREYQIGQCINGRARTKLSKVIGEHAVFSSRNDQVLTNMPSEILNRVRCAQSTERMEIG
jgi:hypothetical protein